MTFQERFYLNFIKDSRWHYLTDGLLVTLEVTFFAVLIGIVIGVIGMIMAIINYPMYKSILASRKKKYGEEILKLSEKLMQ